MKCYMLANRSIAGPLIPPQRFAGDARALQKVANIKCILMLPVKHLEGQQRWREATSQHSCINMRQES